jgi:hypothetical protein
MSCHSTCEDYKAFKKKHDEDMAKKIAEMNIDRMFRDYKNEQVAKTMRTFRKDGKGNKI